MEEDPEGGGTGTALLVCDKAKESWLRRTEWGIWLRDMSLQRCAGRVQLQAALFTPASPSEGDWQQ